MFSVWEGTRVPKPHVEMPKEKDEGDEERMDVHTDDGAIPKNEEFITWNETYRKEDQVCAKIAANELRQVGRRGGCST